MSGRPKLCAAPRRPCFVSIDIHHVFTYLGRLTIKNPLAFSSFHVELEEYMYHPHYRRQID